MDPIEKLNSQKASANTATTTLGELISYYYEKYSEIYEESELRDLAVTSTIDDILARSAGR